MKTLNIEIPDGYEIDTFDKAANQIRFKVKPKSVFERIKTVDDVLADHGFTQEQFNQACKGLSGDETAYRILKLLAKSLNEGWLPDWADSSQDKYFPWFEMKGSSGFRFRDRAAWRTTSLVGSRLCFKSRELAEYAGKQFTDVYKKFMVID